MGKTRLLVALREYLNNATSGRIKCSLVLCNNWWHHVERRIAVHFDNIFTVFERMSATAIETKLEEIVLDEGSPQNLVILFDEAQHLLANQFMPMKCVCKWLRQERYEQQIVAVFTGTTTKLSNFCTLYQEQEIIMVYSRNPQRIVVKNPWTGMKMYQP